MIHFYREMTTKIYETIQNAHDCMDIYNDLNRIEQARQSIQMYGDLMTAQQLNLELRQKYPGINNMLKLADSISTPVMNTQGNCSMSELVNSYLDQDYYGILYDTAVKKQMISDIKEFIKKVE